jgi:hypothetical protein
VPWSPQLDQTKEDFSIQDPKEREAAFGQFDHLRIYGKDYTTRLKNAGFQINKLEFEDLDILKNDIEKMQLNKKECIFIVTK